MDTVNSRCIIDGTLYKITYNITSDKSSDVYEGVLYVDPPVNFRFTDRFAPDVKREDIFLPTTLAEKYREAIVKAIRDPENIDGQFFE